jgi:hypothetical protein
MKEMDFTQFWVGLRQGIVQLKSLLRGFLCLSIESAGDKIQSSAMW